jgi:hypothetical protein
MSAPFAGGFNRSFLNVSKHALRSVTFSSALHFSKLGLLTTQMAAIKRATHNTSSAVLMPNRSSGDSGQATLSSFSCAAFSKSYSERMACLSMPMSGVKHWTPCSELHQDSGQQKYEKAGHGRKRRFALIALQTSYFDWDFHDRTADLKRLASWALRLMCR